MALKPNTFALGGPKIACGASGGNILPLQPCFPSRAPGRHHSQLQNNHIRELEHDDTDFGRFGDLFFGPPRFLIFMPHFLAPDSVD